jgi:class 3 adenylate cyclase
MEAHIRYASTKDGVRIAYSTIGEGIPLIQTPPIPFSQVKLATSMPEDRLMWEAMLGQVQLVRYDARGTGLSDRDVSDFSSDAFVFDLEAVADHAKLERFALWAFVTSGPVAIEYAALHPERVSHLILWSAWARTADVLNLPQARALLSLANMDWELFTETAAHSFFGWSAGEVAHRAAVFLQEGITQETWNRMLDALSDSDVTHFLPRVQAPTLVVHSRGAPLPDIGAARELASRIADARLVVLDGSAAGWVMADEAGAALSDFLNIDATHVRAATTLTPSGAPMTIIFTDLVSSTALTQRLGDVAAQELLHAHNAIVRESLAQHGGTEIKHTGDGIMASFPSASGALSCAVAIQHRVAAHNDPGLRVHIGLNAGEPIAEDADLFGAAVQLARRICDQAVAGEILVSDVVRQLTAGKAFAFHDRGEFVAKGFEEPVRVYEVTWQS